MSVELDFDVLGEGPPLLILHGLFGSRSNWRAIARQLSSTHRVLLPDLRNHGASPWDDEMGYPAMAQDLERLIDTQRLERPVVIGHSMGGKAAMALALAHTDRVGGLIVVDVAPVRYADRMAGFVAAMQAIDLAAAGDRSTVQRMLTQSVPDPAVVPFLMQNLVLRESSLGWRINLAAIGASLGLITGFPDDLRERRHDGPVRVIAGGRSDYVSRRDGAQFQPMFPRVSVDIVADAGHWVHADAPRQVIAIIRDELARPAIGATN